MYIHRKGRCIESEVAQEGRQTLSPAVGFQCGPGAVGTDDFDAP
jgi:hypothetical protein